MRFLDEVHLVGRIFGNLKARSRTVNGLRSKHEQGESKAHAGGAAGVIWLPFSVVFKLVKKYRWQPGIYFAVSLNYNIDKAACIAAPERKVVLQWRVHPSRN